MSQGKEGGREGGRVVQLGVAKKVKVNVVEGLGRIRWTSVLKQQRKRRRRRRRRRRRKVKKRQKEEEEEREERGDAEEECIRSVRIEGCLPLALPPSFSLAFLLRVTHSKCHSCFFFSPLLI